MPRSASGAHDRLWVLVPLCIIILSLLLWAADREMRGGPGYGAELDDAGRAELLLQLSPSPQDVAKRSDEERTEILKANSSSQASSNALTDEERIRLLESF